MYQELFNLLAQEHGITATEGDMQAIVAVAGKVVIKNLWKKPSGECRMENLLVEIELKNGDSDIALVFIGEDETTLYYADDIEDVYSAWDWTDVSRYCLLEDILPAR